MAPSTQNPMRIAILMADTPVPAVVARDGDYGEVFATLFKKATAQLSLPESALSFSKYDVVTKMEYPSLDEVDGILITGSRHNAFDNDPWILKLTDFTKQALDTNRVRVLGICYGHQILGRALGAPVVTNDRWEVSVCPVDLTPKGKELFGKQDLFIQQMHRDIIQDLPEGAVALGSSPVCKVQAMYKPKQYISVQGHPEFTGTIVSDIVDARILSKVFDEQTAEEYKSRAANPHDGVNIAATFIKFMQEE